MVDLITVFLLKFTVFDKVDEFNSNNIQPGLYYVETDSYI